LNTTQGEKIWNYTIGTLWSSFTVNRDAVFINSGWWTKGSSSILNNVFALNALNGNKLWNSIVETTSQGIGFGGTLTVIDDLVYLSSSYNNLYLINASTGARISLYPTEGTIISSPVALNETIIFLSSKDGAIYAYTLPYVPSSLQRSTPTVIQRGELLIIGGIVLIVLFFGFLLLYKKHQKTSKLR